MSHHTFSISDAIRYGVEEAVVISNLRFWLAKNAANERHKYDGYYWTYNSARAFAELFPYWTSNKIQKLLKTMEQKEYILSGVYNERGYDRTKWYSMPEFSVESVDESRRNAIQPNGRMEKSNRLNGNSHLAGPIPDVNADPKQEQNQEHCADAQRSPTVVFDGMDFIVSDALMAKWSKAFPGVNLELEVERASVWAAGNAPKKNWQRFLSNWMSKKGGNGVDETGVPVDQIIDLYHRTCPNLPRTTVAGDKTLRGMIVDRWNEAADHQSGKDFWLPFFRKANSRAQVYYRGQNVVPRLEALVSRAVFREIAEAKV